jgi:hypothetical protein
MSICWKSKFIQIIRNVYQLDNRRVVVESFDKTLHLHSTP